MLNKLTNELKVLIFRVSRVGLGFGKSRFWDKYLIVGGVFGRWENISRGVGKWGKEEKVLIKSILLSNMLLWVIEVLF